MNNRNVSDDFLKLQERYRINLKDKFKKIEECVQKQDLTTLADYFHKLKGSGQTYGFKPISDIAALVHEHYKSQSPDFFQWAQVGLSLLQKIHPTLNTPPSISLNQYPEFQQLESSMKSLIKKEGES